MHVILLGTAAGGAFPQWNCWCPTCRVARTNPALAHPRSQSSIAVSSDGTRWFLVNASPDVREQLARLPTPTPTPTPNPTPLGRAKGGSVRHVPFEAVLLTDAELDHSLGVVLLREAGTISLYATDAVARVLEHDSHVLPTARAFATVTVAPLPMDEVVPLRDRHAAESALTVEAFAIRGDPPRFARHDEPGHTVGLLIRDKAAGTTLVYVPGCAALDAPVLEHLRRADGVLFDGTFWTDDELSTLGISALSARQMGHLPISGPGGSLEALAKLPARVRVRIYTHINNSNPILIEDSAARMTVEAAGVRVGDDGMAFTL